MSTNGARQDKAEESTADAFTVVYTEERGRRKRVRYEPAPEQDGWLRIEQEHTGCTWRTVGLETVRGVSRVSSTEVFPA